MEMLKIDRDVPMPGTGLAGKWKQLAVQMRVGDSVVVPDQKAATGLHGALKTIGGKSAQRMMSRRVHGSEVKELRVWRVK